MTIPCDIHCWHLVTSTQGETCGHDDETCCHCGERQRRFFLIEDDITHGPYISKGRRMKSFDDLELESTT